MGCAMSSDGASGGVSSVVANAVSFHLLGFWGDNYFPATLSRTLSGQVQEDDHLSCTPSEV